MSLCVFGIKDISPYFSRGSSSHFMFLKLTFLESVERQDSCLISVIVSVMTYLCGVIVKHVSQHGADIEGQRYLEAYWRPFIEDAESSVLL